MVFNFDRDQRNLIAEKVMELANLAVAALVIGQILSMQVSFRAAGLGLVMFLVGYTVAFVVIRGGGR